MENTPRQKNNAYAIPTSIIVAGFIIAGSIIVSGGVGGAAVGTMDGTANAGEHGFNNSRSEGAKNVRAVDVEKDHIRGSENAKVTIVEYSDYECPFCARLHPTLSRLVDEYDGELRWVYRHFPLTSIHSRALEASIAAECAATLGGNEAFWDFTDGLFGNQRALGSELYLSLAAQMGLPAEAFETCLSSQESVARIQLDGENALMSGGQGTPFSVVINENGDVFPFSGALPYENIRQIIEAALNS